MRAVIWGGGYYHHCGIHTLVAAACEAGRDDFYDLQEYLANDETPIRPVKNITVSSQVHSKRQNNAPVAGRNY